MLAATGSSTSRMSFRSSDGGSATSSSRRALSPRSSRAAAYTCVTAKLSRSVPPRSAAITRAPASSGASSRVAHSSALKPSLNDMRLPPRALAPALDLHPVAARRRSHRLPAVDDLALRVLVGLPRDGRLLVDSRLGVVADAGGEDLLKRGPLIVGEGNRAVVVRAVERLELALVRVGGQRIAGHGPRRAVDRDDGLAAQVVGDLGPVAVVAAVGRVGRLVARDLLRHRALGLVLLDGRKPLVHGVEAVHLAVG